MRTWSTMPRWIIMVSNWQHARVTILSKFLTSKMALRTKWRTSRATLGLSGKSPGLIQNLATFWLLAVMTGIFFIYLFFFKQAFAFFCSIFLFTLFLSLFTMFVYIFRKVIIWKELGEWTKIYEYTSHDSSVNSVAWAPHEFGLILACGSSDGSISILTNNGETWDAQKINNAHSIGCNAVSWCPVIEPANESGGSSSRMSAKRLATGGCDSMVKIWREDSAEGWIEESKLENHSDWVIWKCLNCHKNKHLYL